MGIGDVVIAGLAANGIYVDRNSIQYCKQMLRNVGSKISSIESYRKLMRKAGGGLAED